eukprot:scaffold3330_cov398-Pinguiococcus_pyrenoidosus.AAC.11
MAPNCGVSLSLLTDSETDAQIQSRYLSFFSFGHLSRDWRPFPTLFWRAFFKSTVEICGLDVRAMSLDEARVAAGEKFLRHPNVQNSPLKQKLQFLESKGLQKSEIDEALRRVGGAQVVSSAPDSFSEGFGGRPPPPPLLFPPQPPLWQRLLLPSSVFGGFALAAFAIHAAVANYRAAKEEESLRAEELREIRLQRRLEALESGASGGDGALEAELELTGEDSDVDKLCVAVARLTREVSRQDELLRNNNSIVSRLVAQVEALHTVSAAQELRREIKAIKSSLEKLGSSQSEEGESLEVVEGRGGEPSSRRKEIDKALEAVKQSNAPSQLVKTAPFLGKLIKNLTLGIPRYRRFPKTTESFEKYLVPLKGSIPLMLACGFEDRGSSFEWTWAQDQLEDKDGIDELLAHAADSLKEFAREAKMQEAPEESSAEGSAAKPVATTE